MILLDESDAEEDDEDDVAIAELDDEADADEDSEDEGTVTNTPRLKFRGALGTESGTANLEVVIPSDEERGVNKKVEGGEDEEEKGENWYLELQSLMAKEKKEDMKRRQTKKKPEGESDDDEDITNGGNGTVDGYRR